MNTDPIADLLTRIRNAYRALHKTVELPHSKVKENLAAVLVKEGYLAEYSVSGDQKKTLHLKLRYVGRQPAITGIQRASKPGLRRYVGADEIPRVLGGMGVPILSTSSGVMSGREARRAHVGGEVMCYVW